MNYPELICYCPECGTYVKVDPSMDREHPAQSSYCPECERYTDAYEETYEEMGKRFNDLKEITRRQAQRMQKEIRDLRELLDNHIT